MEEQSRLKEWNLRDEGETVSIAARSRQKDKQVSHSTKKGHVRRKVWRRGGRGSPQKEGGQPGKHVERDSGVLRDCSRNEEGFGRGRSPDGAEGTSCWEGRKAS